MTGEGDGPGLPAHRSKLPFLIFGLRPHTQLSSSAKAGDPVCRGFSVLSLVSLEYWVTGLRGDDNWMWVGILAARCARGFSVFLAPFKTEGAGNAGCALHPRSHVQWVEEVRT